MPIEQLPDNDPKKESIYEAAESLRNEHPDTRDFVMAVGRFIIDHAMKVSPERRFKPQSIIESRFTPAEEAFEKGMTSCGAIASVSAAMLRHAGLETKLIHGETDQSVDHAWIAVRNPETDEWEQYDLTRNDGAVTPKHAVKMEADSWEDIRGQIEDDHRTLRERREKRGIQNNP